MRGHSILRPSHHDNSTCHPKLFNLHEKQSQTYHHTAAVELVIDVNAR